MSTPPPLVLDFDMSQVYVYTQMIWDVLKPVAYVAVGVGIAFTMFRLVRGAFY